jgi:hypothetical protein
VDAVPSKGFDLDNRDKLRLRGGRHGRHGGVSLGSIGVMKWAGVVLAKPGVLESIRAVNFVGLRKEEPEMAEGFPKDELELRKGVLVGGGSSEIGNKGVDRCLG